MNIRLRYKIDLTQSLKILMVWSTISVKAIDSCIIVAVLREYIEIFYYRVEAWPYMQYLHMLDKNKVF